MKYPIPPQARRSWRGFSIASLLLCVFSSGARAGIGEALDQPGWTWQATSGWTDQAAVTHDAVDAAASGFGYGEKISTSLTGPISVSFWWKRQTSPSFEFTCLVDGLVVKSATATDGKWESATVEVPSGSHEIAWWCLKGPVWLDQITTATAASLSPGEAVESPALTFTSSGDGQWFAQRADVAQSGGTLLRSPTTEAGQSSSVSTQVTGPATVSFWWYGSEIFADTFTCLVDGTQLITYGGGGGGPFSYSIPFQGWIPEKVFIPTGVHTISWKSTPAHSEQRPCMLDNVAVIPNVSNPVGAAIGLPNQTLRMYGSDNWVADSSVFYGTGSSARSSGGAAALGMVMDGPGTLHFRIRATGLGDGGNMGLALQDFNYVGFAVDGAVVLTELSVSGTWIEYNAALSSGRHRLDWYNSSGLATRTYPTMWLDDVYFSSTENLASAIEQDGAPVSGAWVRKTAATHDGFDALESPPLANGASATVSFTLQGPATVHFWTKVSSEADHDRLMVRLENGGELLTLSGELDWQQRQVSIPAGEQVLVWSYAKDGSLSGGQDKAWLDQVEVTPVLLGYAGWQEAWFSPAEIANPLVSGQDADPDHDGLSNLAEFGLGGNPRKVDATQRVSTLTTGAVPFMRFTKSLTADGVIVEARGSSDLSTWTTVPATGVATLGTLQILEVPLTPPIIWAKVRVRVP